MFVHSIRWEMNISFVKKYNLSPNIISWLEHYSYHDVGNFNGASCWVLFKKRKAVEPTFSLQSSMHEAIAGIFTTRHDLHRHIFQLAVASKMTYCMASFTPWNTRVATTAFFKSVSSTLRPSYKAIKVPFRLFELCSTTNDTFLPTYSCCPLTSLFSYTLFEGVKL